MTQIPDIDFAAVRALIRELGREIALPGFARTQSTRKHDGSVVTEIDLAIQQEATARLAAIAPGIALLGEEMSADEQSRLHAGDGPLWCLDPLDGTSNFVSGVPVFAISLALLVAGRSVFGVVYDPVRDECFHAELGAGAWLGDRRLEVTDPAPNLRRAIALIDFKRLKPPLSWALASAAPYRSQRSIGSVALDWCWLADGRCDVYLHGGQRLWDWAAGELILREAGGVSATLDGLDQAQASLTPRSAVAATSTALFNDWREWLSAAASRSP